MQADLPAPPTISVLNKEDEEFFPIHPDTTLFSVLKKVSYTISIFALIELLMGILFMTILPPNFTTPFLLLALLSCSLAAITVFSTQSATRNVEKIDNLSLSSKQKKDRLSIQLAIWLGLLKLITTTIYVNTYILDSSQIKVPSPYTILVYTTLAIEIALSLLTLITTGAFLKVMQESQRLAINITFLLNAFMLSSTIGLMLTTTRSSDSEAFFKLSSLFGYSQSTPMMLYGYLGIISSILVWIIVHRRWRVGALLLAILLLGISLPLFKFSKDSKDQAGNIYVDNQAALDSIALELQIAPTTDLEVEAYRCQSKYSSPTDFNQECTGLYSQLYITQLLQASTLSFSTALLASITAISLLYSIKTSQESHEERRSPRNYKWLAFMSIAGLTMMLVYGSPSLDQITMEDRVNSEVMSTWSLGNLFNKAAADNTLNTATNNFNTGANDALGVFSKLRDDLTTGVNSRVPSGKLLNPSDFSSELDLFMFLEDSSSNSTANTSQTLHPSISNNTRDTIIQMFANRTSDYLILGLDQNLTEIIILDQGKTGNSYDAFAQKFRDEKSQITILDLWVENENRFVVIIYVPDSASQAEKDIYNTFIIPQAQNLTESKGVPFLITKNLLDLKLANVLKYTFQWQQIIPIRPESNQRAKINSLQSSQQNISAVLFRLDSKYINSDVQKSLNELILDKKYKYVLLGWTNASLSVVKKAPSNATYEDFLKDLVTGQSQIALLDFEFEEKEVPVLISWNPVLIYSQQWQTQAYQLLLLEVSTLDIPYYEPHSQAELNLHNLVDFLSTFWPEQINSYSKYTSNQLLSVLQTQDSTENPGGLLSPFYKQEEGDDEPVLAQMLLRRSLKYLLFQEVQDGGETKLLFKKAAPKTATVEDFLADVKGNGNQLALLYLDFINQDRIVCLVMTDSVSLEKNYINYARIASAAQVYDIPTAYVSSPNHIDLEQLTLFTFTPNVLRILEDLDIEADVTEQWRRFSQGTNRGYALLRIQDNFSKLKVEKVVNNENVTYEGFKKELKDDRPLYAIININNGDQREEEGNTTRLFSWIPSNSSLPAKIVYKQAEPIVLDELSKVNIVIQQNNSTEVEVIPAAPINQTVSE